jgi:hypothetical protein
MTRPDRDYDDILSRMLHSTLDPVEPGGDGLAKIQKRIAEPWLKRRVSLLRAELAALAWLIFVRCEPLFSRVRSAFAGTSAGSRGHRKTARPALCAAAAPASPARYRVERDRRGLPGAGRRWWVGPTMAWLRPTLAVGGAVVIVVAGVFALGQFREAFINPADSGSATTGGSHGGAPSPGTAGGVPRLGSNTERHNSGKTSAHRQAGKPVSGGTARPSPTCSASPSPSPSNSPTTPTGGGQTSPSPSPSNNGGSAEDAAAVVLPGHLILGSCRTPVGPRHPVASPPSAS